MTVESKTVSNGETGRVHLSAPENSYLPDDVLAFASDNGIVAYVQKALTAAREVFAGAERVTASLKRTEYDDTFVDIQAVVRDEPEAEAEKYSACVEQWASLMPPHAGGKIHLSTLWA